MPSPQAHSNTSTFPTRKNAPPNGSRPLFSPKRNAPEYSLESIIKDSKELYHHRSTDRLPAESPLQYALRCSTTAPLQIQCLYNDDHILVHMQRHARSNQQPHLMEHPETPQGLITLHLVHFHSQRHPYLPYLRPQRALIVLHPRHQSSTFSSSCLRPQSSTCFLFFLSSSSTCPFIGPWELITPWSSFIALVLSSFGSWDLINPTAFDHHGPTCSALTYALAQRFIHTERPSSTTSLKDRFSQQLDPHDLNTNARRRIKIGTRTANNFSDTAACTANNIGTCTYSTTPARHCCLHRQ